MRTTLKKRLADELLVSMVFVVLAIALPPGLMAGIMIPARILFEYGHGSVIELYGSWLKALFVEPKAAAWLICVGPIGLYQLVRSITWGVKTLRK